MKYWKGKISTQKENQCGTMDDSGQVTDSIEITKKEYDEWVASQPIITPEETDFEHLVAWAKTKGYVPKPKKVK